MSNPFANRAPSLNGPATDIRPVVPSDSTDLPVVACAIYAETGGVVVIDTLHGVQRSVRVADMAILPVAVRRVRQTGTTALNIHVLTVL